MPYNETISRLRVLTATDRSVDLEIAQIVGYRRTVTVIEGDKRSIWYEPDGSTARRVPSYTGSVSDAIDLAHALLPDHVGGCSWEKGMTMGSARVNDGPYVQAASPAIALCIAALLAASGG